jgi:hypothetical protein
MVAAMRIPKGAPLPEAVLEFSRQIAAAADACSEGGAMSVNHSEQQGQVLQKTRAQRVRGTA